ncbi:MAG TPA: NTPase [Aggregatilineaceae bacterium]|jgi:nucleoside-triphosphatase|nr:NTPase [Aggregatilineaceae bacterium]
MNKNILLTGNPGCGKTTLIQRVVARLRCPVGGFYTQEIREEGARLGFKVITFDGQEGILAHVAVDSPLRVGKYGVDLQALESVGVTSVQRALDESALVVVDEIGPMELFSKPFCQVVLDALDSEHVLFGSVMKRSQPFADQVKARPDVTVIEVHRGHRDALAEQVLARLLATGRCSTP